MISQGWDGVEVFRQADTLRKEIGRLKANPHDAGAAGSSANRGWTRANWRRPSRFSANRSTWNPTTSAHGTCCERRCSEGLRRDFATYSAHADEIEPLLADTNQRILFSRLMAEGLRKAGQWRAAFDQYVRLIDMEGGDRILETAGPSWLVRRDRWLWGRVRSLCDQAGDKAKAEIDRALGRSLERGPGKQFAR